MHRNKEAGLLPMPLWHQNCTIYGWIIQHITLYSRNLSRKLECMTKSCEKEFTVNNYWICIDHWKPNTGQIEKIGVFRKIFSSIF